MQNRQKFNLIMDLNKIAKMELILSRQQERRDQI